MKCLLDTHIFLWVTILPRKLPTKIKKLLLDPDNTKIVSAVSFWEISLKYNLGKLDLKGVLPDQLPEVARQSGLEVLNLEAETAASFYMQSKLKGKDPFDRMLSWQAQTNECVLLTVDQDLGPLMPGG